jgi:hypothetical protein
MEQGGKGLGPGYVWTSYGAGLVHRSNEAILYLYGKELNGIR